MAKRPRKVVAKALKANSAHAGTPVLGTPMLGVKQKPKQPINFTVKSIVITPEITPPKFGVK